MNAAQMLPDLRRISCDGSLLYDFIETFPSACCIRDRRTNKYLAVNYPMVADFGGLQAVDDVIGFTPHDMLFDNTIQKKRNLTQNILSDHSKLIQLHSKIENQIVFSKRPTRIRRFNLTSNGNVEFAHIIKMGVQNHEQNIIAFLSISIDLIAQVPLPKLFRLYQEFYPKKEAIQKFLNHESVT